MATAVTFNLRTVSPNRMRYAVVSTGGGGPLTVLPNAGAATPDLRTDAVGAGDGSGRNLLLEILSTPVVTQVDARILLQGDFDGSVATLDESRNPHCELRLTQRGDGAGPAAWNVDVDEGANAGNAPSAGFAVIIVDIPTAVGAGLLAYLDVIAVYSKYQ